MYRSARRLLLISIVLTLGWAGSAHAGGTPDPDYPYFTPAAFTVAPGGQFVLIEVSCGTLGTEPIATELWAFPSGTTIATGTATIAGGGTLDVPLDTPLGEYRLEIKCSPNVGYGHAVFVGDAPPPVTPTSPVTPSTAGTPDTRAADTTVTPSAAGTVARPRFTG
jgi:hypothetical protein